LHENDLRDLMALRSGALEDGALRFDHPVRPAGTG
jgi:hypothetical protein